MNAMCSVRKIWTASALLALTLAVAGSLPSACYAIEEGSGFVANYFFEGVAGDPPNGAFSPVRIISKEDPGGPSVCAQIYVFDPTQEMVECCSCLITGGGETGTSVFRFASNPAGFLTPPTSGEVKIVSTVPQPSCGAGQLLGPSGPGQETSLTSTVVPHGLGGYIIHAPIDGDHVLMDEVRFVDTREPPEDLLDLAIECSSIQGGAGVCGCPNESPIVVP